MCDFDNCSEIILVDLVKFLQEKEITDFKFERYEDIIFLIINSKYKYPIRSDFDFETFKICLNKYIENSDNKICYICDENKTKLGCIYCGNMCCSKCYIKIVYTNQGSFLCPCCRKNIKLIEDYKNSNIDLTKFSYKMLINPKIKTLNLDEFLDKVKKVKR